MGIKSIKTIAIVATIALASCVTEGVETATAPSADPCWHQANLNADEIRVVGNSSPDLGNGNIGLYTAGRDGNLPRFSLLNCKSAKFTQVTSGSNIADLKNLVDSYVKSTNATSVDGFSSFSASANGVRVVQSVAPRQEATRAGCVCGVLYERDWYSGFPPGYVHLYPSIQAPPQ